MSYSGSGIQVGYVSAEGRKCYFEVSNFVQKWGS